MISAGTFIAALQQSAVRHVKSHFGVGQAIPIVVSCFPGSSKRIVLHSISIGNDMDETRLAYREDEICLL